MIRPWDARKTYLLLRALAAFGFSVTFTINMIYQVAMVGLSPLQLVLVGTTLEIAAFLFEIPTGVVADVFSRRLSIIIGYFLIGLGFMVEAYPTFATVLIAQAIWGIGYTFTSGATDAWLVDEIGIEASTKVMVQGERLSQLAGFAAMWVSILIGMIQLNFPHFVGAAAMIILAISLIVLMPEAGFKRIPKEERESWGDLFKTLRAGITLIRGRTILMLIIATTLMIGLFSEGWDRLQTAHLLENFGLANPSESFETLILFGIMGSIGSFITIVATTWLEKRNLQTHQSLSKALMILFSLMAIGIFAFTWSNNLWLAIAALWLVGTSRSMIGPIYMPWINQHVDSNVRATVLSVDSQSNALGQIVGGPPVGYLGNIYGLRLALSISGALLLPVVLLIGRVWTIGGEKARFVSEAAD
jgi:DHA3 family tetracycline resistance protein-like MFS transporter